MWDIIGTALLAFSAGTVFGAYWIVKYVPARGADLDEEDRRTFDQKAADQLDHDSHPVTHLVVGGTTGCCGVRTNKLPWGDHVTISEDAVTCKERWW